MFLGITTSAWRRQLMHKASMHMDRLRSYYRILHHSRMLRVSAFIILLVPYVLYLRFVVVNDRGPVDYETFMATGTSFLEGGQVYGENSYYPLPYIAVFAAFSRMPRPLSLCLWLAAPVLVAIVAAGFRPGGLACVGDISCMPRSMHCEYRPGLPSSCSLLGACRYRHLGGFSRPSHYSSWYLAFRVEEKSVYMSQVCCSLSYPFSLCERLRMEMGRR
jgi:hypothetical protein